MLYQLKKDNQKMMELLQKIDMRELITPAPNVTYNNNVVINKDSGSLMGMEMQGMITDIFYKLERILEGVRHGSNRDSGAGTGRNNSPQKTKRSKESPTKKRKSDDSKRDQLRQDNIGYKITHELETLKVYIVGLSSTCEQLVKQL